VSWSSFGKRVGTGQSGFACMRPILREFRQLMNECPAGGVTEGERRVGGKAFIIHLAPRDYRIFVIQTSNSLSTNFHSGLSFVARCWDRSALKSVWCFSS